MKESKSIDGFLIGSYMSGGNPALA